MSELLTSRPGASDVVDLCSQMLAIDSSNYGDGTGALERDCAEWLMEQLSNAGYDPVYLESAEKRSNVIVHVAGSDPTAEGLLIHGHLDVVPADPDEWSIPPFSGEILDGMLWGRGAVDMKGMNAMMLSLLLDMKKFNVTPPRDLTFAFLADEEAGGSYGAGWLVEHHADLFSGCTHAISEVGGFSLTLNDQRCYLLQTQEKGLLWLRLVAQGRAGHGSQVGTDNAVAKLCAAVTRIESHAWDIEINDTVRQFLDVVGDIIGRPLDPTDMEQLQHELGTAARWVGATVRNTANATVLNAGYKHNVIPSQATALIDCRPLPGRREQLLDTIAELAGPDISVEIVHDHPSVSTDMVGAFPDAMVNALLAEDPSARVAPYCLSGGTDNKSFQRLGIRGFGFAPLKLPPDLDFAGLFHGVDERVPAESIQFGRRVLERLVLHTYRAAPPQGD